MAGVLNFFRFTGMTLFFLGILLFVVTVLNNWLGFAATMWLEGHVWRVYIFFAVSGILMYILITFRRKKAIKKAPE
ncbi:hypothetical protein BHE17_13865 [Planococcus maritimus]|uniref:hypothetical protein n=1 Tax=Planococcus maritimus TaxID=192421 RepID=UPI00084BD20F|nr:hypothetical protein [Planococcus maritimus]OED33485.1 hypothetical protein BHE17_13865 [Planococcus maritimus]